MLGPLSVLTAVLEEPVTVPGRGRTTEPALA